MKFRSLSSVPVVMILALAPIGAQAAEETPKAIPGGVAVSAEQAKAQFDKGALFIDARVAAEYAEKHIKGAKNVPYKEKSPKDVKFDPKEDSFDLAKLPGDKNAAVIFYCNGAECWKSFKASKVAIDAGYKKVNWLRGGIPEWKAKGYPVE